MRTGDPLKETKDMIEDETNKQVHTRIGSILRNKEILRDENYKQVCTSTGDPLKKKEMFRDEKVKQVRTYAGVVYTGKLSNERERGTYFK